MLILASMSLSTGPQTPSKYEGGILSINRIAQMNGRGVVIVQLQKKKQQLFIS